MREHLLSSMKFLAVTALLNGAICAPALAKPPVAQKQSYAAKKVTSVEGITEYILPNGLRVLLFPDPSSATITTNITYHT